MPYQEMTRQPLPNEIRFVASLEEIEGRLSPQAMDRYKIAKRTLEFGEDPCARIEVNEQGCASCALYGLEQSDRFCAKRQMLAERNGTIIPE